MIITIPTYGRPKEQKTYSQIPLSRMDKTYLVVQAREAHLYEKYPNVLVLPSGIQSIAPTRQWILDVFPTQKVVQIDDDFTICCRRGEGTKLFIAEEHEIEKLFNDIEEALDTYSHVGVSARQGNNRVEEDRKEIARMTGFTACNVPKVREVARYDRMVVQEDLDFTLQLLRAGHPNLVFYDFCYNQPGSNTKGGCSSFRTLEVQEEAAHKLAELHPGFVKVVEKETKTSWNGKKRTDVTVYWKKAYGK